MSHYTILLINEENVEEALNPFWELDLSREEMKKDDRAEFIIKFKKEDLEKEFKKFKEEHKEDLDKGEKDYWVKYKTCSAIEWLNSWEGLYLNKEETNYGYYTNPKAKWDWYQIGGRWASMIKLKKDVDKSNYDKANFSYGWEEKDKKKAKGIDSAYKKDITLACLKKLQTFAVLKEGVWYEKGSMGWWGMSDETKKEAEKWDKGFYDNFIKKLKGDTLLTIVDLHI